MTSCVHKTGYVIVFFIYIKENKTVLVISFECWHFFFCFLFEVQEQTRLFLTHPSRLFQVTFSTLAPFLCKESLIFLKSYLFENMTRLTTNVQHRHWRSTMWATWHFQALVFKRDLHQPWKILHGVVWLVVFIIISLWIIKGQLKPVLFSDRKL